MEHLAGLGMFFGGLGLFFVGIGVLWGISVYDREAQANRRD